MKKVECYYCDGSGELFDQCSLEDVDCLGCNGTGEMTEEEFRDTYASHQAMENAILQDEMVRGLNDDDGWF